MLAPLSIPSPPSDFQGIPVGEWLHGLLPFIPETQEIRTYAIAILMGIVAAVLITQRRLTARGADPAVVVDIAIWAVPLGIVGARVFHVLTHPNDYFGPDKNLLEVFAIWNGGIAIFGALIGGAIGIYIACKITGLRFTAFVDALAPGLLVAQAFGRLGNYFNHELYGLPTNLPWGLEIEAANPAYPAGLPAGVLFHPTFLYEIVWNLIGVAVLLYLERQWRLEKKTIFGVTLPVPTGGRVRLQWGKLIALYLIWYGLGRTVWESIRIDPSEIFFGIRTNVWAALLAILVGVIVFAAQSRRHYGLEPGPYVPGREWRPVVDSEETYSDAVEPGDVAAASVVKVAAEAKAPAATKRSEKPATSGTGKKS